MDDTEGSEFEILRAFKFDEYDIGIVTVEHNYREPERQAISIYCIEGLCSRFRAVLKIDDWYVKQSIFGVKSDLMPAI